MKTKAYRGSLSPKLWIVATVIVATVFALIISEESTFLVDQTSERNGTPPEKLYTKKFEVPLNFLELVAPPALKRDPFATIEDTPAIDDRASAYGFMEHYGVVLGPKAQILFHAENGILEVTNTPDQLRLMGEVVATFPKLTLAEERALVSSIVAFPITKAERVQDTAVEKIEGKLNQIRIPNLTFKKTPLGEVLSTIQQKSIECDKDPIPSHRGIPSIYYPTPNFSPDNQEENPTVTLQLSNATISEVLHHALKQVGCKFRIEPYAIIITPNETPDLEFFSTKCILPPDIYEKMMRKSEAGLADPFAAPHPKVKAPYPVRTALENFGITFPSGACARYDKTTSELFVTNTADQLELVKALLSNLDDGKMIFQKGSRFHRDPTEPKPSKD